MLRILVADDDPHLREVVAFALTRAGFEVTEVSDGRGAVNGYAAVDLVVLDIVMPEMDGIEACRQIRAKSRVPIVFLSSRDEEFDRVLGLELGADDYLTKPFSPRELVARVRAVLRRAAPADPTPSPLPSTLSVGRIQLDPVEHRVTVHPDGLNSGRVELPFTVTEFAILKALMGRPGKVYTRDELTDLAYGERHHLSDRTLDSHIRRIRAHFRAFDLDPIETVHGLGYRLRK
ncbi:MAG: response regulator transcription factor [Myxococcales bacterium]|nr:response regulator transcription factor [Myxococcales bacterium]